MFPLAKWTHTWKLGRSKHAPCLCVRTLMKGIPCNRSIVWSLSSLSSPYLLLSAQLFSAQKRKIFVEDCSCLSVASNVSVASLGI